MVSKANQSKTAAEKTKTDKASWPDFAISLYDKLTGRGAEITYEFNDMNVAIPTKTGEEADHFHWKINGSMTISTQDQVNDEPGKEPESDE
jgi:hypothetical protein